MKKSRHSIELITVTQKRTYGNFSITFLASLVLLVQLFLPLSPLFAFEDGENIEQEQTPSEINETPAEVTPEPSSSDPVSAEAEVDAPLNTESTEIVEEIIVIEEESVVDPTTEIEAAELEEDVLEPVIPEEPVLEIPLDSPVEVIDEVGTTTPPVEEVFEEVVEQTEEVPELPIEEEEIIVDEVGTTTPVTVVQPEVHTVTNDENKFSFGVDDCAQVADGSFYCKKAAEAPKVMSEDRVFAGPDKEGDNEIYIEREGELIQISSNTQEDEAPYYDTESDTIVWHRLINGRYQIVSYKVELAEETILTHDHYNNMQPSRIGDTTVWQGWVGNDWEILLMEGEEITMITDNTVHDIGPRINGDHIIWQAEESDGWKVRVYNRLTKETETISDAEGASIENPRLVLLYDAKDENGDVETRGYDLESGETVPIGAIPHTAPEDIPDPDQTGEDRALINGSAQLKTKTEDESEPLPDSDNATATPPVAVTDDPTDIIIPSNPIDTEDVPVEDIATTTEDLVIPPLDTLEIEQPVEDLVIPPLLLDEKDEVLPQQ